MTVAPKDIYLYSATVWDYEKALAAAAVCGIPKQNVIGNYSQVWRLVVDGKELVIAVGEAALYALYFNPCNWANPKGVKAGHTPFELFPPQKGVEEVSANMFVNAAGNTAQDSIKLVVLLTYYAVHGTFPNPLQNLPKQKTPEPICVKGAVPNVAMQSSAASAYRPPETSNVGIYASFRSTSEVLRALQLGWKGIGVTGGLGTPHSPYTMVLSNHPDEAISVALDQSNGDVWWLSFWTVSWPSASDSFHAAGHAGGTYVASQITSLRGKYVPNFVVLDPEGYNTPARTRTEWADFIRGFVEGMYAVNPNLKAAFYCNQSQYQTYGLESLPYEAFIAVAPINGNRPFVKGSNIVGYIAYTAKCPATTSVEQVKSWGGRFNTVQFGDSGVDCAP